MPEEKLLTEPELLAALNIQVERSAVWRWRKKGMPYIKVGKVNRYDLAAVREWLASHGTEDSGLSWEWSVWTWTPEDESPSGKVQPGFWYQECLCRSQIDAENIKKLFEKGHPWMHVRASKTKPEDIPDKVRADGEEAQKP